MSRQATLRELLERLEEVERRWEDESCRRTELAALRGRLAVLAETTDVPAIRHVAPLVREDAELRELAAWIVPIERALDRRIRDEDFLPVTDRPGAAPSTMPVQVIADSLRSSFNVGGVFRTAECFGIEGVVLAGYTATPEDRRVAKAAMGTADAVPWRRARRAIEVVRELRAGGVQVLALETGADSRPLREVGVRFPCAVLLGNERHGSDGTLLEAADATVCIPTHGRKNSLNVVAACAVVLDELRNRWGAGR